MNIKAFDILIGAAIVGVIVASHYLIEHDDTDPANGRSGLVPYTDHKTGCQYLKAGAFFGSALTPRLTADGKPMCGAAAQK